MKLCAIDLSCIRQQKMIFNHLSFQLNPGEALFIEGQNGSGKSSLLRLLAGIATPSQGEIRWDNKPIQHIRTDYSDNLHYIGHTNGIKSGLTILENLRLAKHLAQSVLLDEKVESVLTHLQLNTYKHTQAKYLSAGQKRRLALAKLFLFPKKIWLLDEPLTALDAHTQTIFLLALEQHLQKEGIVIISSHHPIQLKNHPGQLLRLTA